MNIAIPYPPALPGRHPCHGHAGRARSSVAILGAAILTLVAFPSACPTEAADASPPPLRFVGDKDYPPVAYLEEGAAKGMDVDLARALGGPMNREVRIELMDWTLAQQKILSGEADGLLGLSITEDRRKLYDFAKPTFTREFGIVVRSSELVIRRVEDLAGKRVGVTAGGFPRRFLTDNPGASLVLIDNYVDGLDRLADGKLDAIAADQWVAAYLIEKGGRRGLTIVGKSFASLPGAIAVRKGNSTLLGEINGAIGRLEAEGRISRIQDDWRPQQMLFASRAKVREFVVRAGVLGLVLLFALMWLWIVTLRRQMGIRRRAEAAVRESETKYRTLFESAQDAIFLMNDGVFLDCNRRTEEMFGGPRDAIVGHSPVDFSPAFQPGGRDSVEEAKRRIRDAMQGRPQFFEWVHRRPDGTQFEAEVSLNRVLLGGEWFLQAIVRDITTRKLADQAEHERAQAVMREQQARVQYTFQLIASQEAERTRIAAGLHDSLGQKLLIIKNRCQLALGEGVGPREVLAQAEGISTLASEAIAEVRQISHDLHPYQLDHLGITRALEAMIDSASEGGGVIFERKLDRVDDLFSTEDATNLYRVVQESMNNILKHSRATRARLVLERDVKELILRIEDDGCGFEAGLAAGGGKGLGLRNIAERVHILNGRLKVDSRPGAGTRIEVTIPLVGVD